MDIVTDLAALRPPPGGTAVTIGAYDGLHLGHRALIAELSARAAEDGLTTAVVTFDRHPATVVRPESAPCLLCDLDQRLELLESTGIELAVVVPFDHERANETAEDFVNQILVDRLGARLVVVGEDFHFGHGRKGNVALLAEMGQTAGFDVDGVSLSTGRDGSAGTSEAVSSTRIRTAIAEGRVEDAAALLGRPHQVRGTVVPGDQRGGSELGYPTANVDVPPGICLPAIGIYAAWYGRPDGSEQPAAVSVGRRPTFYDDGAPLLVEAHLLDFDGDLYGERAQVSFVSRLRDEEEFDSVDALVEQMQRDVELTRERLTPAR